jgi:predicted Rossmann fold nucleotide-binding protein DprA/Smf involved in DNA uptake
MKYAIVGSRKRTDRQTVVDLVGRLPSGSVIVSGGADGPDTWAAEEAEARGLQTIIHLPEGGPSATRWAATEKFYARNQKIVDDADCVFALVDPSRKGGTEDTIRRATRKGIPVTIV